MFTLELLIAKRMLPEYGGSYLVWGACVVFFQAILLLGYVCAHSFITKIKFPSFRWVYVCLLILPFFFFPGHVIHLGAAGQHVPLPVDIFLKLLLSIGPVFLALSTVSIALQVWLASSSLKDRANPYGLYAVSNVGSLMALFLYPFFFEFRFGLSDQEMFWRIAYGVLVGLNLLALALIPVKVSAMEVSSEHLPEVAPVTVGQKRDWLMLGAAGVVLMLAVTHVLTVEIAPMPLLWVIPLAVYLLSFVVTFKKTSWCPQWISKNISVWLGLMFVLSLLISKRVLPMALSLCFMTTLQFLISVYCQNRLIGSKPQHHKDLSLFYTLMSLGGFCGGILTTWIIPLLSNHFIELIVGLLMVALVVPRQEQPLPLNLRNARWMMYYIPFVFLWFAIFTAGYNMIGFVVLLGLTIFFYKKLQMVRWALAFNFLIFLLSYPILDSMMDEDMVVAQKRNFYGIYRVTKNESVVRLKHGSIVHGYQMVDPARAQDPTSYYSLKTPVGEILSSDRFHFQNIGAVGLGIGTVAAYVTPDQSIDFYELDPLVHAMAEQYFSYLKNSRGQIKVIYGDARVSLSQRPDQKYDVLIIDAFSGDAVPTHLMTVDMIEQYRSHLNPGGLLLFHVSNGYVYLWPVLARVAYEAQAMCFSKANAGDDDLTAQSLWVSLVWDQASADILSREMDWQSIVISPEVLQKNFLLWRDDYSTLLPLIKKDHIMIEMKAFNFFQCAWPDWTSKAAVTH